MLNMVNKSQQCLQCEYKATTKSGLQKHVRSIHEGQKFPCLHCGSTFSQKGNLQTHMKSVHKGQKIPCPHCEYKATQKGALRDTLNQSMKAKSSHAHIVNSKQM